ncbi:hypothetical protein [Jiangella asiatica]|uniref:Uncharacterized protein n=1 Tax=Jiangella asiatica TaxID=2530372 RepID=A0A4R5CRF8_9ACTN|nr:hypothetical protein [Jiangella asiatica]TDE02816.1 hypothetical protein E1269_21225 [Jiangella asiatica]
MPTPSRLLPCPLCGAEVERFTMTAAYAVATPRGVEIVTPVTEVSGPYPDRMMERVTDHDRWTLLPCGHQFERREHPGWVATFASEGE